MQSRLRSGFKSASPGSKSNGTGKKERPKISVYSQPVTSTPKYWNSEKRVHVKWLADAVKAKRALLKLCSGPPTVYKVPLEEEQVNVYGCKRFRFGKESTKPNRTVIFLGAAGAGRSNLINGMINYVLGVEWEDPHRFRLVDEGQPPSEVTVYKINHQEGFKINHSLTVVDTPGFGDAGGLEDDAEITEQLGYLFSAEFGVSEIDAVCLVVEAASARLAPSQIYGFDSVLSIFGKDVAENIQVLVTSADGQKPPVLSVINASGVPCPQTKSGLPIHFKFNNSALFADNKSEGMIEDDESFDEMFWNMGTNSMKTFFAALNVTETKSLKMTNKVLRERQKLEKAVQQLQKQVQVGLAKFQEITETADKLREHEAEISRCKKFEFESTVLDAIQVDISGTGLYLNSCEQCYFTCHCPCRRSHNTGDKRRCCAMGADGYCTHCPGKCFWTQHVDQRYKWESEEVHKKRTVKKLKRKYQNAKDVKKCYQALMDKQIHEYEPVRAEVEALTETSVKSLKRLKETALQADRLLTPEYIDTIIEGEKREAESGWRRRVQSLKVRREKAEVMAKVGRGEKLLPSPNTDLLSPDSDDTETITKRPRLK